MNRAQRDGLGLVGLAAAGYACLPIFAKWAYAAGLTAADLVTWRFVVATPLVWLAWRVLGAGQRPGRAGERALPRGRLLGMGALFAVTSLTAFFALERIPSSTYTVILYTYPAMVALASAALGERLAARGWAALLLTLLGVALTVPQPGAALRAGNAAGLGLALLNAALYTVYLLLSNRLLRGQSDLVGASAWSISGSLALLAALALARGLVPPPNGAAWASVAALATVSTVLPTVAIYGGMKRLGAARAAILSTVEPLLTLLLAATLLGERMAPVQWLGGALILASVIALNLRPDTARR